MNNLFESLSNKIYNNKKNQDFINLKNIEINEFKILYQLNDIYSTKKLSDIKNKNQLLFQKYAIITQQLNLSVFETIFPEILADITIETFLNNVRTFNEYMILQNKSFSIKESRSKNFLKYKLRLFINYLLFSNIDSESVFNGKLYNDRIYCLKNNSNEIKYYSVLDQNELLKLLFDKLILQINNKNSFLQNDKVQLCLTMKFI